MNQNSNPDQYEHEFSLVDIVKALKRRKRVFFISFFLVVLISAGFILSKKMAPPVEKKSVTVTSYLSIGFRAANVLFEPLESIKIAVQEIYRDESEHDYPVMVEANWKTMGNVVKLITRVPGMDDTTRKEIVRHHEYIIDRLVSHHASISDQIVAGQADYIKQYTLIPTKAMAVGKIKKTTRSYTAFHPEKMVMYLISSVFAGLMLAFVMVFLAELVSNVRSALEKDQNRDR